MHKCGNTKEECPPLIPGLPRHFAPRNDRGMDSRLRGNDIKGSGNTKEECHPDSMGVLQYAPTTHHKKGKNNFIMKK